MASRFWILSNEDAKAPFFRQRHTSANGGTWSHNPKSGWTWKPDEKIELTKQDIHIEPTKTKKSLFKKKNKETNDN